jgi:hypothetical protein
MRKKRGPTRNIKPPKGLKKHSEYGTKLAIRPKHKNLSRIKQIQFFYEIIIEQGLLKHFEKGDT